MGGKKPKITFYHYFMNEIEKLVPSGENTLSQIKRPHQLKSSVHDFSVVTLLDPCLGQLPVWSRA